MSVINTKDDILKEMSEVEQCPDIITKLRFLIQRRNTLSQRLGISGDSFTIRILDEAISKLEAREPHVMTLEEVKEARICWIEDVYDGMNERLFPAVVKGTGERANGDKAIIVLAHKPWCYGADFHEWWYYIKDYCKWWRPWSQKPTDERREETEWQNQ